MRDDQSDTVTRDGLKISTASILIAMASWVGIFFGIWYSWDGRMHGEIEPQTASLLFAPAVWIASRQSLVDHRFHRLALASAWCCFGLGWFVYLTDIRMGYMDWIMTEGVVQNPHSHGLLLAYFLGSVVVCLLAVCYPSKSRGILVPC